MLRLLSFLTQKYELVAYSPNNRVKKEEEARKVPYFFSYVKANLCLLAMPLVRNGQLLATLGAAACQYTTTIGSSHSLTETVLVSAAAVRGLECSFHSYVLFLFVFTQWVSGCKITYFFVNDQTFLPFFLVFYINYCTFAHEKECFFPLLSASEYKPIVKFRIYD